MTFNKEGKRLLDSSGTLPPLTALMLHRKVTQLNTLSVFSLWEHFHEPSESIDKYKLQTIEG